ncbi:MAG TPA: peptide chain release factor 2 [Gammaproteobacteria bacterium]|nr:peptide chain release factor 2 [Gammaproteobacteria bacterium]
MIEVTSVHLRIKDLMKRLDDIRRYLDIDHKRERLQEVERELEDPGIWNDPEKAQQLGRERAQLDTVVSGIQKIETALADSRELFDLAVEENDTTSADFIVKELDRVTKEIEQLEFQRMFSGEMDANSAFMDIQSGSGGTEAQDWANMILRMYLRFGESHGFQVELMEASAGDVAGIKSATVKFSGPYAYGWLRTETGVHRLVRKSPFDSNNKRHTSFASVFVSPEIDDKIDIDINPADLRIDTYRASGAGGQHVNRTDSAIRITHIPTNTVVQCQSDRSQHKNRASAMKQLRAKLYELEMQKKRAKQDELEAGKMDVTWGSQIRSYVLDMSRIKDLRTGIEIANTQAVLDGDLDKFIEASLLSGL